MSCLSYSALHDVSCHAGASSVCYLSVLSPPFAPAKSFPVLEPPNFPPSDTPPLSSPNRSSVPLRYFQLLSPLSFLLLIYTFFPRSNVFLAVSFTYGPVPTNPALDGPFFFYGFQYLGSVGIHSQWILLFKQASKSISQHACPIARPH